MGFFNSRSIRFGSGGLELLRRAHMLLTLSGDRLWKRIVQGLRRHKSCAFPLESQQVLAGLIYCNS